LATNDLAIPVNAGQLCIAKLADRSGVFRRRQKIDRWVAFPEGKNCDPHESSLP
jgi:hypothetical protein